MDHHFGLGDLGGADPSNSAAPAYLPVGDGRGFMVLGVSPELAAAPLVAVGDDVHVVVQGVHVDDQTRCVQILHGCPRLGPVIIVHEKLRFSLSAEIPPTPLYERGAY